MNLQPGNAFAFLVETLFNLYLTVLMLRILLEAVRADYYNPISQILIRFTEPLIAPLRGLLPNFGRLSTAGIVWLLVLQIVGVVLVVMIGGGTPAIGALIPVAVARLVRMLLILYLVLIFINVILSWMGGYARHPIVPMIRQLVDPVLNPIRRVLPSFGGLDLSPLVAIIAIQFLLVLLAF